MKKRLVSLLLTLSMVFSMVPMLGIGVWAASQKPPKLTNPAISPVEVSGVTYEGKYSGTVSNSSSLTVRWEDVDADYYSVAVKALYGEPNLGASEDGTFLYEYTEKYSKTYISISLSDIKASAGQWIKVYIKPCYSDGNFYNCHYYFKVKDSTILAEPDITVESIDSSSSLKISWDKVSGATGYEIYRSTKTTSSSFKLVHTINSGNTTSWTDTGLEADTKYYYKMKAFNNSTTSDFSNRDYATTDEETGGAKFDHEPTLDLSISGNYLGNNVYGTYYPGVDTIYFNCTADYSDHVFVQINNSQLTFGNPNGVQVSAGTFVAMDSESTAKKSYTNGKAFQLHITIPEGVPAGDYTISVTATDGVYDPATQSSIPGTSYYGSVKESLTVRIGEKSSGGAVSNEKKDFTSFSDAENMIRYSYSSDWSEVGIINYVEQYWSGGNDSYYYTDANAKNGRSEGYWTNNSQASGKCTRAAASMALSYMGITALPKNFNPTLSPYAPYAESLGCTTAGDDNETRGSLYSISLSEFKKWYERYANDTTGKYSPIILHTYYNGGMHAFAVFGRDANDNDFYYIVDSGTGYHVGKVKLAEVDGYIRIKEYRNSNNQVVSKYSSSYKMMGVWQYIKDGSSTDTPHVHSYTIEDYEEAHPHKTYTKCSCGEFGSYTGTKKISSCKECYPTVSDSEIHSKYDADKAVEYAKKWTVKSNITNGIAGPCEYGHTTKCTGYHPEKYNPLYNKYSDNDCANYVSQCLVNGGLPTDSVWYKDSSIWKSCNALLAYLTDDPRAGKYAGTISSPYNYSFYPAGEFTTADIEVGDLIWTGSSFGHVMIVTGECVGNYVVYCGHTNDRKDGKIAISELSGLVKMNSNDSTTSHTHSYTLTNHEKAHVAELNGHRVYYVCSCGDIGDYTGTVTKLEGCSECYPPKPTNLPGDINCDGKVSFGDVIKLLTCIFMKTSHNYQGTLDLNGDGRESMDDVIRLILYIYNRTTFKINY